MIDIKRTAETQLARGIYEVLMDVYENSPWRLEQIEQDLSSSQTWYAVAMEGEDVLGFLAVQENDFEVEVLHIAVKKAYQGQGLASALFALLPKNKEVFLEVRASNQPALLFYQKEEFKEIARRKSYYHEPVEDAIIMKREINER